MNKNESRSGFTLIELLVVIVIISVLGLIGVTSYRSANVSSRDARRMADMEQLKSALEIRKLDVGNYPSCNGGGAPNCSPQASCYTGVLANAIYNSIPKYISAMPADPLSGNTYRFCSDGNSYRLQYTSEKSGANEDVYNPI